MPGQAGRRVAAAGKIGEARRVLAGRVPERSPRRVDMLVELAGGLSRKDVVDGDPGHSRTEHAR